MKILSISNLLPYPLDNGGKINCYTKLKALHQGGHTVDFICFKEKQEENKDDVREVEKYCRSVKQFFLPIVTADNKSYMMKKALVSLFTPYSLGTYKFLSMELVRYLEELAKKEQYDCIYYNYLQQSIYAKYTSKLWPKAKVVIDEHNCETIIMRRSEEAASNPLMKLFLKLEASKLGRFEKKGLTSADHVIVLSDADYQSMREIAGKDFKHTIIPTGVPDFPVKTNHDTGSDMLNILFIGTLTWAPNNLALLWFFKEVVPLLEQDGKPYHLYVVGKNPSDAVKKFADDHPNVTITGYVPSVEEYYDKCQLMVVPIFVGSGLRVKIIEAYSHGMPVVSTTIGAEGIQYQDGESILIADDGPAFVEQINKLRDPEARKAMSLNARKVYDRDHSIQAMARQLNGMLEQL